MQPSRLVLDVTPELRALLEALLHRDLKPENVPVADRDVKPANPVAAPIVPLAAHPANTREGIQPMPEPSSDEGKSLAVARSLAIEAGKTEQEAETFVLEVLRKDHARVRRALHAILEMKAKGKPPRDAVSYFWALYNRNAGVEGGNWSEFEASAAERPAALAKKKTPPIAGYAEWTADDTKAWREMSEEERAAWRTARDDWKAKNKTAEVGP